MAFLTIVSQDLEVSTDGAHRPQDIDVGNRTSRSFSGNLRTSVRAQKKVWEFVTGPMTPANVATLRTAIDNGAHVSVSGTLIVGAPVTSLVTITDEEFVADASVPTTYKVVLRLRIEAV